MEYLIKFDENGRRAETHLAETEEQINELLNKGFELVEEDIYQLLIGNVDGKEHVKCVTENLDTGELIVSYEPYVPPAPTEEEIQQYFEVAIEAMMNETVQKRNYKDIVSACSYAVSTDETFRKEGEACVVWRDSCWRKCYDILAEVKAGTRPIPKLEEVIAELPVLDW